MKTKFILPLFILLNCISIVTIAQKGFLNKEEATNLYKDSFKEGKWVEYTDYQFNPVDTSISRAALYRLVIYNAGKENGIVRYYLIDSVNLLWDEVFFLNGKKNGIEKWYGRDRSILDETPYTNGKVNGIVKSHFRSGKLLYQCPYINDSANGTEKLYFEDGKLNSLIPYINSKQNGLKKDYDENGRLISETPYINDRIKGTKRDYYYYADGKLRSVATYIDNDQNGVQNEYDKKGKLIATKNIASGNEEHFDWEEKDKKVIAIAEKIDRNNPKNVENIFSQGQKIHKDTLGFGWTQSYIGLGGGYISIYAYFYYYNDSIISYTIVPEIPSYDTSLQKKYKQWYYPFFTQFDTIKYTIGQGHSHNYTVLKMQPFKYNEQGILQPLKEYSMIKSPTVLSKKILDYMKPDIGGDLSYGWGGGLPVTMFPCRKGFNAIKDSLTKDEITALLYSINPASRLMAIEYCIKKKNTILQDKQIEEWIDRIYKEVPMINTLNGCFGSTESSKSLVEYYSKMP
jgi:antitoxin component YwqK of YwqJK toxin-antitoxin module